MGDASRHRHDRRGDDATLIAALAQAFAGTAQRVPGPEWARIWCLEDGFQTTVPRSFQRLYSGRENDRRP